jgi:enoyl-CoA hydratase/carnithine racemase
MRFGRINNDDSAIALGQYGYADADQWLLATRTADFREGVSSFFEKRPPDFTGD